MLLGCGRCEIHFPQGFFPTEGFTMQAHPLFVRALLLGDENPFLLVSIEMTSLPDDAVALLRETAARLAQTDVQRVWITVTHTFSAPHILPDHVLKTQKEHAQKADLQRILLESVFGAVKQAKAALQETTLDIQQGESRVLANRDIELPDGWWVGCGGTGDSDRTLTVLRATSEEKTRLILFHLNVQSSVLDQTGAADGKCVSGDLAGIACSALEKQCPDATAIFLVGAAGDQAPVRKASGFVPDGQSGYREIDLHEKGVVVAEELGQALAGEVKALLARKGKPLQGNAGTFNACVTVETKKMNRNLHELKPTRSCAWELEGESLQPIAVLTLGNLAILGVKPELTWATDRQIKASSPFAYTLIATLVNGGAKYMAHQQAYDKAMYEAMNSPFAPGSAEKLAKRAEELLKDAAHARLSQPVQ